MLGHRVPVGDGAGSGVGVGRRLGVIVDVVRRRVHFRAAVAQRGARGQRRLIHHFGLYPVRLHDLRHISATLSLLAKNDIKVVQERLGHSSRQITSDTYTSVLPELMRSEAESTLSVVPRGADLAFTVEHALKIPDDIFHRDIAVIYAHGASHSGVWAITAKTTAAGEALGEIRAKGRTPEHAAEAARRWIEDHCANNGLKIARAENLNDEFPEDQRPYFTLTRFLIDRATGADADGWAPPQQPAPTSDSSTVSSEEAPTEAA